MRQWGLVRVEPDCVISEGSLGIRETYHYAFVFTKPNSIASTEVSHTCGTHEVKYRMYSYMPMNTEM